MFKKITRKTYELQKSTEFLFYVYSATVCFIGFLSMFIRAICRLREATTAKRIKIDL